MKAHFDGYTFENANEIQSVINEKILKKCKNAIIIGDLPFLEYFHLTLTGLEKFVAIGGALNIEELSTQTNVYDRSYPKALIFLSKPLGDEVLTQLKQILTSSSFQFLTIITNIHFDLYENGEKYWDEVKDQLLMSMGNANFTCDIEFYKFPFTFLPSIHSNIKLFLNPLCAWSSNMPNYDLIPFEIYDHLLKNQVIDTYPSLIHSQSQMNVRDQMSRASELIGDGCLNSVAYSINQMLELLDSKDDCFTLGLLSKMISYELGNMQSTKMRRKNASNKVTLILVDRTLDLATPAFYHEETTYDKIRNLLPSLNPLSNDVQVNLSEVLFDNKYKSVDNGNFYHASNLSCCHLINTFLLNKPKECLIEIYRKLNEIMPSSRNETIKSSMKASRITIDTIRKQIKEQIKDNTDKFVENMDFIQIVFTFYLANEQSAKYDKLVSYCKVRYMTSFY